MRQKKNAMLLLLVGKSMDVLDRFLLRKAVPTPPRPPPTVSTLLLYAITYNNDALLSHYYYQNNPIKLIKI